MTYATNDRARFDFEILDSYEAGLVLTGQEVKGVRKGKGSIKGSYVKILDGKHGQEAWLIGAHIAPYQPGNVAESYDNQRSRKLLLTKKELDYLIGKTQEQGLTLVPIKIFDKHGLIKLEIGLARGKKRSDKREIIKKRDVERIIRRGIKK